MCIVVSYFTHNMAIFIALPGQDIGDGTIVLSYKGERQKIGIVEIYYDGAWSSICADGSFSQAEANVVCRQLQADYGNAKYSNTTRHPEYACI